MKFDKRKRFAIRKISVGVASVLVGLFFVGSMVNAPQVNASELKSEEGVEVNKGVEERSTKEVTSEEISVPEPYRAPATFVAPTTENDSTVVSTTESTTEVTVKETEKTTVAIAPSTAPLAEKKAELKVDEKEVPETEAKPEVDAILQPLKEQLNNSILEAKAVNQEAEKQEAKLDDSESKKVLSDALQASKAELVVAQQLSEKAQLTKADLELSIGRLQSAIESVYTEMKRSGHSGFVSYMLADNASTPSDGKTPYMTIENYSGFHTLIHNGTTVEVRYKMGLTRITSDEVELSQGAKDLGLTYDPVGEYVYGTLNLNGGIPSGTYDIGLVSKTNPNVKATLPLTITKPHSYALSTLSNDRFDLSASKANDYYDQATGDMGENNTRVNKYTIPTTPFGYYLTPGYSDNTPVTVADAKPDTPKYNTELGLYVADDSRVTAFPSTPVLLERIERLDTTPEVEYELAVTGDPYGKFYSDENWMVHDPNRTPYRLRFTKLPAQQGTFTIKFKTIDKLGQERIFNVELTTEERSKATTDDANGFYLTNADVKFTPNTKTAVLNKEGIVSVPRSDKEQTIGKIELNKVNAKVKPVRFPDGTEYDEATQTIKKKAGVKLAPGKYNFEVRAIDGHFGDNAPNRVFQFEVTDVISPIDHQVWKEGEKFPSIPVTLEGGSTIANIRVTTNSGDTYATVSSDNITKTLEGYGVLQTTENKTARVEVDYYNADGGISTTFTTFTFEVKPRDGIGVDLDVTNHEQTIKEGEKFKDMVITHTDGATLKVDTAALPKGTRYNKATKTIAGKGLVEGTYRIKVIAEKDGQAVQKYVTLTVLPGPLHAENYTREVTVGDEIDPIEIAIPNRAEFSGDIRGELGLNYDYNTKILSGTTNSVGTKTYTYKLKRGLEEATGTITITVKPRPITVNSGEQTVEVGTPITNFVIQPSERADIGYIRYGTFEAGIQNLPSGLTYDPDTKTISGTPTSVGEFTVNYIAYYKGLENDTAQGTFKLTVTKKPIQVTGGETEVQVLTKMTPVKVEASEGATISVDLNDYSKPSNPLTGKYPSILPEGVTYDESTHTFSGTPKKLGIYRIPVKARYENFYGNDQADGEVVIKVTESPVAIEISNKEQTVTVGDAITPAVVTHNNLSTVTMKTPYGLVEESEINAIIAEYGLTYDPATKTFTGTPTKAGTFTIRMQATNAAEVGGASAIDTFTLTVNPKAEKGLDLKVSGGRQLVQLGKAITDITLTHTPGSELTLDETSLPAGVTFDAATKTISGTPTAVGSYTAKATATLDGKSVSKDVIIDVVDIKDGKDGKDGKSPVVTVKDNEDGTHTVKVVNPDGTTTETVIKNGKDGKTPTVTVKDNQDGTHTVKVVNPNGTTTETVIKNGKDGKTPTVTVKDNQDGTHTVKVVNPDGETTETIIKDGKNPSVTTERGEDSEGNTGTWVITHNPAGTETGRTFVKDGKDGKDGKTPTITIESGKDEEGRSGVWVIVRDSEGNITSRNFIRDGKDGKTPKVRTESGKDKEGNTGVWVITEDGDGKETSRTFVRDGKDGKTPSITTEPGKNKEGQSGYWIIIKDGEGKETNRIFIRDCGCPKKEDPKPKPQPDPKPQPQPDPKPQPQPDPKPQPQPDPKPQPQPDPKPQPQPDPKPQPQSDPKPQPQPDPKPQLQSDPKPQPQPDPKPQPQLPPQPIEDKVIPINKFRNGEPQKELPNTGTEELPFLSLAAFIGLASAGFALSQKKREED